ncbi:MAG: M28 family peptidase [Cytophagales bacterium]|nr:M28 family peptidase [Cytophagales bacterium]
MRTPAYRFIEEQLAFGPRVPNSMGHRLCQAYLVAQLGHWGASVQEQRFEARSYEEKVLNLTNIIASWRPELPKRILLAAHWDSRHLADKDSQGQGEPILGANDGASGVAVCMEIMRTLALAGQKPKVGVDVILFDGEDQGEPHRSTQYDQEPGKVWWCLGSQYWSKNKHQPNYTAYFGILFDMVGAQNATFYQEGTSLHYAPSVVHKVWQTAAHLGYANYFIAQRVDGIVDDHVFVNRDGKINMVDIVQHDPSSDDFFGEYHHTHRDNLEIISPETLQAVGQTVLQVIYNE